MKLRTAKKIVKSIDTRDESRYNRCQLERALNRIEKTQSARSDKRYVDAILDLAFKQDRENYIDSFNNDFIDRILARHDDI